jgi:hypothetical protein
VTSAAALEQALREWTQAKVVELLEAAAKHRTKDLFSAPVSDEEAPRYSQIVKQPMDYQRVRARIAAGQCATLEELARLVALIVANCKAYNPPSPDRKGAHGGHGTGYFSWAVALEE